MKYTLGIDLGGTNIAAGIVDENYNILIKGSRPTLAKRPPEEIAADMAEHCKDLCVKLGISLSDISCVGIAIPGTVNCSTGIVEYANNIRFRNFPMREIFSRFSGIPEKKIAIGNDANVAALGEAVGGAAKGTSSSVMITLGTGVGGGVIIDGKVLTGCAFGGAELGHTVMVMDGRQCSCGRKGCVEAYCSATALVNITKEKMEACHDSLMWNLCNGNIENAGGRTSFDAMRAGDKAGTEVVDEYTSYLACAIANFINIFQPEVFLIGGGISNERDYLMKPVIEKTKKEVYSATHTLVTDLRIAALGNDAAIVGAAALAEAEIKTK
ncbi:MAG TPA: glucokinase [Clostridiales bacterium]|jgi:glucokinase|nr:glucokinase [Candidatus Apopatosoma intestinale]